MIRVKIIETEDRINMLEALQQISNWLHIDCLNQKFCQNTNSDCKSCDIRSLCEESDELRCWASMQIEKYNG